MPAIKKQSLVDQVYEKLRGDIISLQIPLGSRLNVNELQDELEVSCTPIREAINRLQQEGLVTYENNVGARIFTLDAHDVEEIQQLAMTLHCAAIRLAMERENAAVLGDEVEKHLNEYQKAKTIQTEVMAIYHLVGVFYRHCGNRRLDKSMISIQGQQLLLRYIYAVNKGEQKDTAYFERMLRGVQTAKTDVVCEALADYTNACTPVILSHIRENGEQS